MLTENETSLYPVGTKYTPKRKHSQECTIVDIHKTYNLAGELVKLRYVATHEFCGQTVMDTDVISTTIARAIG